MAFSQNEADIMAYGAVVRGNHEALIVALSYGADPNFNIKEPVIGDDIVEYLGLTTLAVKHAIYSESGFKNLRALLSAGGHPGVYPGMPELHTKMAGEPQNVSLIPLGVAIEYEMLVRKGELALPSHSTRKKMFKETLALLLDNGAQLRDVSANHGGIFAYLLKDKVDADMKSYIIASLLEVATTQRDEVNALMEVKVGGGATAISLLLRQMSSLDKKTPKPKEVASLKSSVARMIQNNIKLDIKEPTGPTAKELLYERFPELIRDQVAADVALGAVDAVRIRRPGI